MKIAKAILLAFLITNSILAVNNIPPISSSEQTIISINPQKISSAAGESFIVEIFVNNVSDLCAWQLKISFNPAVINCSGIIIPADNIFSGHETTGLSVEINNIAGYLRAFNGLWETQGVNGSGKLCQIRFNSLRGGFSSLVLDKESAVDTCLWDSKNNYLPFETVDGFVHVVSEGFQLYKFETTVGGNSYNITIYANFTVSNFSFSELSEKISLFANSTSHSYGSCDISIPWCILNGTLAVTADGSSLSYTTSADSIYRYLHFTFYFENSDKTLCVFTTILGDLDGNRKVDMKDIAVCAKAFGSTPDHPRWDARADINNDLVVNMKDISSIAKNFGKIWEKQG